VSEPLIDLHDVSAGYGAGLVLHELSFSIAPGASLAVLGRNGVGKSTLMLTIMGHLRVRGGTLAFKGRDVTNLAPYRRVAAGLGWVPQERDVFPSLTVDEHLTISRRAGAWDRNRVYELFPRLRERARNLGSQLSGGEQQMLAIGRALMTNPSLLLLDEPLEGLAPVVVAEVAVCVRRLMSEERIAIMLVEQHAKFALELTRDAIILDRGRIVYAGPSAALRDDQTMLDRLIGMRRLHESGSEPNTATR